MPEQAMKDLNLRCPYCEKEISLTWRHYFRSSLRHKCPHCYRKALIDWPLPYIALSLLVAFVIFASARLISAAVFDDWRTVPAFKFRLCFYVVAFVCWLPVDRLLCARCRRLHQV
jgi:hypothetical protein